MILRKQFINWLKQKLAIVLCIALVFGSFQAVLAPQEVMAAGSGQAISASEGETIYVLGSGDEVTIDAGITLDTVTLAVYQNDLNGATVVIENVQPGDELRFTAQNGITGTYDSGNGVLTLSGVASFEDYRNALSGVAFATSSSEPSDRTISFNLGSALAFGENGHYYEYINKGASITWSAAIAEAAARSYFGRQGYLVTITSETENNFVKEKTQGLGWLGAQDIERKNGEAIQTGDWRWVTGPEGLEDSGNGFQFFTGYVPSGAAVQDRYNNWETNADGSLKEPNNHGGQEYVAHIFGPGGQAGKWNDFSPVNPSVQGYIVEYGGMPGDSNIQISATKVLTFVDKAALQAKVTELNNAIGNESLQEEDYTPESWAALEEALQAAQVVLDNPNATQAEVNEALADLEAVYGALTKWVPQPVSAVLEESNGQKQITLTFDKGVQLTSSDASTGFTIMLGDEVVTIASVTVDETDPAKVILTLAEDTDLTDVDQLSVAYDNVGLNLNGTNDTVVDSFAITAEAPFASALKITEPGTDTVNVLQPEIAGVVEAGSTVTVTVKDKDGNPVQDAVGEAIVDENGNWSFTPAVDLPPGEYTIEVTAEKGGKTATKTKTLIIVDKSALQTKVDEINGENLQEENYTEASWQMLQEALVAAQAVLENPEATQTEVDDALEALTAAREGLVVDKTALQAKVNEINGENLQEENYTEESWQALQEALSLAEELLEDPNATPQAVKEALEALTAARAELAADKTALQAKVDEINGENLQEENYTGESWTALEEALQAAQVVLNDSDATQAEVDEALTALTAARNGLEPVTSEVPSSGLNSIIPSTGTLQPNFAADSYDYTMTVGNSTAQIQFTLTSSNPDATITINGTTVTSGQASDQFNLSVGENKFTVAVTEQDGTTKNYTITVTRQGSSGGVFFPSNPVQRITVNVEASGQGVVAQTEIERTSNNDGTKSDKVTFVPEKATEAVEKTREAGATAVRIVIPDTQDEVRDVRVNLPQAALKAVQEAGLDLEIFTDNGMITIPNASLADINPNLYFYLVPIKKESERKEVEERAKKEKQVQEILNDGTVYVVDRPMTIETNMTSRQVKITLPMDRSHLPSDAAEREAFLADLVIFIEHSDGERKLVKPEIGQYSNGKLGLTFTIEKFSTFTILNMSNWGTYLQAQEELAEMPEGAEGLHHAYINGYPDGTFKPSRSLTRAEMAAILSRVMEQETADAHTAYPDVASTHWAQQAISQVSQTGLMQGYPDGKFRSEKAISRAEMAAIVARWMKLEGATEHSFSDVDGHWAEQLIASVSQAGYMEGYADGNFEPDKAVTRAEAVVIINRVLERGPLYNMTEPTWSDVPMSHWAFHHIEEASQDHYYNLRPEGGETIVK
ncbi:S-layer homology domain-containing protein [Paenibacillus tarimensis]